MARTAPRLDRDPGMMEDPPITRWLFNSTTAAWGWLAVRMYVGYQWVVAGEHKVADPAWMSTSEALKGFWVRASAIPAAPAKPVVSFDWDRDFLKFLLDAEAYTWFAKLVAVGELLIGGPGAQREIKQLFAQLHVGPITPEVVELTAQTISRVRGTEEAKQGFAAFLAKQPAPWIPKP